MYIETDYIESGTMLECRYRWIQRNAKKYAEGVINNMDTIIFKPCASLDVLYYFLLPSFSIRHSCLVSMEADKTATLIMNSQQGC